jgi:bifunctional DNase/RNase
VPIYAEEAVLDEAGLVMPDEREDEVEKFKEFLESVSPDDFKATDG